MIDPLPKRRSICDMAAASAFSFSGLIGMLFLPYALVLDVPASKW
jgi:hypothetical protein